MLCRELGDRTIAAESLEGLACGAGARGEAKRAAKLFGAAEALREAVGYWQEPRERALREPYLAAARSQMDEASWQEAKIAFVSDRNGNNDIFTMNADGTGVANLTNNNPDFVWFPAWSPDGQKIAFAGSRAGNEDIYTINVDGTGAVRLTDQLGMAGSPTWQPVD